VRWLVTAVVAAGLAFVLGVVLWPMRRTGPEPIVYGKDACAHCRMPLSRPGFGGEMRDARGVLTKYDDVGCLVQAMRAQRGEIREAWVEDHVTGRLVPLLGATLVRGQPGATPMASGVVAFADRAAAESFARTEGGEIVALEQLLQQSAPLAREEAR
jgi:copper chaperone NosL